MVGGAAHVHNCSAGDVVKDIALLPEGQPLGIVNRKTAVEIISQLQQYAAAGDGRIASRGMLLDGKRGTGKVCALGRLDEQYAELRPQPRRNVGAAKRVDGRYGTLAVEICQGNRKHQEIDPMPECTYR